MTKRTPTRSRGRRTRSLSAEQFGAHRFRVLELERGMPVCSSVSDSNLKSELATGTASVSELEVERCRSRRDRDGVDVDGSY